MNRASAGEGRTAIGRVVARRGELYQKGRFFGLVSSKTKG
jgi:hypothetical protein